LTNDRCRNGLTARRKELVQYFRDTDFDLESWPDCQHLRYLRIELRLFWNGMERLPVDRHLRSADQQPGVERGGGRRRFDRHNLFHQEPVQAEASRPFIERRLGHVEGADQLLALNEYEFPAWCCSSSGRWALK